MMISDQLRSLVPGAQDLTDEQIAALGVLADYFGPDMAEHPAVLAQDIVSFAEHNFYIPETKQPIVLQPHQPLILRYAFDPVNKFQTIFYSTIKKSGKTTIASLVARWVAETWGDFNEIYCLANDEEQARGRVYSGIQQSIELDPAFDRVKNVLPGRWRVIGRELQCLSTRSVVKAVSGDYRGEAGSNPTATFWSELWGYTSEASLRLWDELTPVPTRPRSIRYVETYAGFEDESSLLFDLWNLAQKGRQLTIDDIPDWPGPEGFPGYPRELPLWVHDGARLFAYIDQGFVARRMPWQNEDYYKAQAATLRDKVFRRLHFNEWTTSTTAFLPNIQWWDACSSPLPRPDKNVPMVIAVDAAVSDDCIGVVMTSRHPSDERRDTDVAVRYAQKWDPPEGGKFDYEEEDGLLPTIRKLCKEYDVVEVAYDAYQLHQPMTNLNNEGVAWCRPFSQMGDRTKADRDLYGLIRDRHIAHEGDQVIREHLQNAAAQLSVKEDNRSRLVKKTASQKIDLAVCLSMASYETLRLNL